MYEFIKKMSQFANAEKKGNPQKRTKPTSVLDRFLLKEPSRKLKK